MPRNTPADIIEKLNKEIAVALADPNIKARFAALGGNVFPLSPGEFGKLLADETAKWGKVVRAANIRLERHSAGCLICSLPKPLRDFHGCHNETPTKRIPIVMPWRWCWCFSSRLADCHG